FDQVNYFFPSPKLLQQLSLFKSQPGKKLVVVSAFEKISAKNSILEKLHQLRQPTMAGLTYLVISDHTVVTNSSQYLAESTPFFSHHFLLTPFDQKQTEIMVKYNDDFYGWKTPLASLSRLFELSGGIQRFTKHMCKLVSERHVSLDQVDELLLDPSIMFQLQLLTKIISQSTKLQLMTLGIVNQAGQFKSQLLQKYLAANYDSLVLQYYPSLTPLESKLFALLHQNQNQVVTMDRVGDVLELLGCEFSPWAIYKLVSRLKPKVAPQYKINSIKGRGYLLTSA
ncbi:MAG: helix-turn-helix domain-containing protein, partial [bacterium]|nr:helix-turn-helix domain-containing protein [bacterium]